MLFWIQMWIMLEEVIMEKIRIDLVRLKTEEDALNRFGRLKGMPEDYNSELEELRGILQAWDKPLKIEIVIGKKYRSIYKADGDARGRKNNK